MDLGHDLLPAHLDLDKLRRLLHGAAMAHDSVKRQDVDTLGAWDWGSMLAARVMRSELDITRILDHLARRDHRAVVRFSDRALVLVANRLRTPGSELRWRSGWRATSSAIALAGASSPAGETTPSAKQAGRHGFLRRKVHECIAQRWGRIKRRVTVLFQYSHCRPFSASALSASTCRV
jgi:hypothetical protein